MKVQVQVNKPSGDIAILSYEAPDDSQVGDVGTVPMFSREVHHEITCDGKIVSLRTGYEGAVKKFTPTTTPAPIDTPMGLEDDRAGEAGE